ncbi:MAG: hypothetical protein ABFD79_00615 [Phycisphaerales bacterium]
MKEYILEIFSNFIDEYEDYSPNKKRVIKIATILIPCILFSGIIRSCRSEHSVPKSIQRKIGLLDLSQKDKQKDKWELDLIKGQPVSELNIPAGFGPPLLIRTEAIFKKKREISFGILVKGRGGEKYVGGIRKNGVWQPPPGFKIVDSKGKVLESSAFKYG